MAPSSKTHSPLSTQTKAQLNLLFKDRAWSALPTNIQNTDTVLKGMIGKSEDKKHSRRQGDVVDLPNRYLFAMLTLCSQQNWLLGR